MTSTNANGLLALRDDFPILQKEVHGKPLVYLDNGATSQKPQVVIDTIRRFYETENANIHRGVHYLSMAATDSYDQARNTIAKGLNAADPSELVFVRGTTEAINLVAHSWGGARLKEGDEILLSEMEHHANIVPWQFLAERKGLQLRVWPMTDEGLLRMEALPKLLNDRTRLIALTHISNVLGTVNPVAEICATARERGITTLIDGAQRLPHGPVDLQELGCDFYAFSSHKAFGPDGIGVLYARGDLLRDMPPYQGGGDMVARVTFEKSTFKPPPDKFEAGTPNISGAIGLGAAFDYHASIDWDAVHAHEDALRDAAIEALTAIPGLHLQGTTPGKAPIVSFTMDEVHPHDIATVLDSEGVAIRAGNHCAQPLMARLGVPASARASFALYNTLEDVEVLAKAVHKAHRFFA